MVGEEEQGPAELVRAVQCATARGQAWPSVAVRAQIGPEGAERGSGGAAGMWPGHSDDLTASKLLANSIEPLERSIRQREAARGRVRWG